MDKIERMREDVRNLKLDEDAKKAMNLILDIMEDYRADNKFVQRVVNGYWCKCSKEGEPDGIPKYSQRDCVPYYPTKY